ncbi:MAG: PIG-L deacetylase family protein [Dehalococcoidia bacterium]
MKRVLVFAAHGDDMEFMAGGTVVKLARLGHHVTLVVATDNDKGSFELSADKLRAARDREIRGAAEVLGVKDVITLGYSDGDLAYQTTPRELRGQLMQIVREQKADIVFTWDPFAPYEGHPDHRAVAVAASEAATFAHFPLYYPEQLRDGMEPHYVGEHWFFAKAPRDQNKFVDIDATIETKIEALYRHDSQMVLTIADLQFGLRASGLDVPQLDRLDPHDYREIIAKQMRGMGRAAAARSGLSCTYAEGFRRTRYGGIESWAKGQEIPEVVA